MFPYKIIISNSNMKKEYTLPEDDRMLYIGTVQGCNIRLKPELCDCSIKLMLIRSGIWNEEAEYEITAEDNTYIRDVTELGRSISNSMQRLRSVKLKYGRSCVICNEANEELFEVTLVINFDEKLPRINNYINLEADKNIYISDDENAKLVIISKYGRGNSLEIVNTGVDYVLNVKTAPYGIKANGNSVERSIRLKNYDYITCGDIAFFYKEGRILFDIKQLRPSGIENHVIQKEGVFEYPKFIRNTRLEAKLSDEPVAILDPDNMPNEPEINIVTSLMPAIVMFGLCVLFRGFLNKTGGSFVLYSICSMGIGVITSVVSIVYEKNKYRRQLKDRKENYARYIEEKNNQI